MSTLLSLSGSIRARMHFWVSCGLFGWFHLLQDLSQSYKFKSWIQCLWSHNNCKFATSLLIITVKNIIFCVTAAKKNTLSFYVFNAVSLEVLIYFFLHRWPGQPLDPLHQGRYPECRRLFSLEGSSLLRLEFFCVSTTTGNRKMCVHSGVLCSIKLLFQFTCIKKHELEFIS